MEVTGGLEMRGSGNSGYRTQEELGDAGMEATNRSTCLWEGTQKSGVSGEGFFMTADAWARS